MSENNSAESELVEDEVLQWTVFLLKRSPAKGVFALLVLIFTTYFVWSFSASAWLAGFSAFVLLASLATFFFPTSFRLDAETIRVRNPLYWRTRHWKEFRGLRRRDDKVKLVTLSRDSRLDNFRGQLIVLPDDPTEVLAFMGRHIETK